MVFCVWKLVLGGRAERAPLLLCGVIDLSAQQPVCLSAQQPVSLSARLLNSLNSLFIVEEEDAGAEDCFVFGLDGLGERGGVV